ncbi:unnamed protein product [Clavelina lepadiformis]|uniref:phytanoyl-CoA dioxygenase n=1 Tax=Clavelina lepadiformis TaxID=159417 RepID=A0ABP0GSU0_CLALP
MKTANSVVHSYSCCYSLAVEIFVSFVADTFCSKMQSVRRCEVIKGHLKRNEVSSLSAEIVQDNHHYTLDGFDILSKEDCEFYDKNGFFVVRGLVPDHELHRYNDRFQKICKKEIKVPGMIIMRDVAIAKSEFVPGEQAVTKIQDYQNDPVMFEYCTNQNILQYVEAFIGKDVMAMHTMLINKPPDPGAKTSRHPMHQDLHYFPFRPANRIVCSWTAMQKVDRSNGCLVVVPGSHKIAKLLPHVYPKWEGGVNKMYHGIQDYDPNSPRVHLSMEPGDTVFFHPLLIHGSGTNITTGFRKAISCHYASSDCHYIDVDGTAQENISKEVAEVAKRRVGPDVQFDFKDIWYIKAKLAQGERKNL